MASTATTRRDWTTSPLGERVMHICEMRGWTLNKLGEEAGIASGPMSKLSRHPELVGASPDTLARIADASGVSVLWLMLGRGPVETGSHHPKALRNHADWFTALADAKKQQYGIPEEFWTLAGDAVLNVSHIDWQLIVGVAREMYSAHQRSVDIGDDAPDPSRRSHKR